MIRRIVQLLESLLVLNRATESLLVDIIASYSPWLAPIVPALMTYQNMTVYLGFPNWVGLVGAAVVETLGLSAVQTAVSFWMWNDSKMKSAPKAPFVLAVFTGLFYLTTVLIVNAMLDESADINRLAKALLSSLSVCAGVILALRAGHARRVSESEQARAELRASRVAMKHKVVSQPTVISSEAPGKAEVVRPLAGTGGNGHH